TEPGHELHEHAVDGVVEREGRILKARTQDVAVLDERFAVEEDEGARGLGPLGLLSRGVVEPPGAGDVVGRDGDALEFNKVAEGLAGPGAGLSALPGEAGSELLVLRTHPRPVPFFP